MSSLIIMLLRMD